MLLGLVAVESNDARVSLEEREGRNGHRGAIVWFTGRPGAGKTTLAIHLDRALFNQGVSTFILDGDDLRDGLSSDLGFSAEDRTENVRRAAEIAALIARNGLVVLVSLISPFSASRRYARELAIGANVYFIEVYVDAPIEVCARRDPKGLYAKAQAGALKNFTGVSHPYEAPISPDVVLQTAHTEIATCVQLCLARILSVIKAPCTLLPESVHPSQTEEATQWS